MEKELKIIVEKLKKIPDCEGIVFCGSRVEGDFSKDSDYDFTVLVSKGKSYYKIFKYKKYLVDVCVATFDVIKKQDLVRSRLSNAELHIIASGQILYDKYGKMKSLQKKAKAIWLKGPKIITPKLKSAYQCTNFLHKLEKDTTGTAYFSLNQIITKTVLLFFELNNSWQPKAFNVEKEIKKLDPKFLTIYNTVWNAQGLKRVKAAVRLIRYLMERFNLSETEEIYTAKS